MNILREQPLDILKAILTWLGSSYWIFQMFINMAREQPSEYISFGGYLNKLKEQLLGI